MEATWVSFSRAERAAGLERKAGERQELSGYCNNPCTLSFLCLSAAVFCLELFAVHFQPLRYRFISVPPSNPPPTHAEMLTQSNAPLRAGGLPSPRPPQHALLPFSPFVTMLIQAFHTLCDEFPIEIRVKVCAMSAWTNQALSGTCFSGSVGSRGGGPDDCPSQSAQDRHGVCCCPVGLFVEHQLHVPEGPGLKC